MWRMMETEEGLVQRLQTNTHPLHDLRINAIVQQFVSRKANGGKATIENKKVFLESVFADKELPEKVSKADKETLIAIAKDPGIELTDADFAKTAAQPMSDADLHSCRTRRR